MYTEEFFLSRQNLALHSAKVVVPLIIDLFHPKSVIDIGCGNGIWLSVFFEKGVSDILGVDGSYVKEELLMISPHSYKSHDLNKPLRLDRKFDVALCLEVAEHLSTESSELLINTLTNLSDCVVFSAAIPRQPGNNHINCQWPEYWISLFDQNGFSLLNSLRYKIWNATEVAFWYKQNLLAFVKNETLEKDPNLMLEYEKSKYFPVNIVHPQLYLTIAEHQEGTFSEIVLSRVQRKIKNLKSVLKKIFTIR